MGKKMGGRKRSRSQIASILDVTEESLSTRNPRADVSKTLASDGKVSQELSSVWSLPPAHLLRFRTETPLHSVDGSTIPGFDGTKKDAQRFIDLSARSSDRYQQLLYANGASGSPQRLLIILQGMDASGKGSAVRQVFAQVNPMGIHYHGFGAPTKEELEHDFLWRVRRELPKPGWIGVFDRSHYEDIIMPRIYNLYPPEVWEPRYELINEFEHELATSGCKIIKIFLVISKDQQKQHFLKRLSDPTKYWKFDESDLEARSRWDEYMDAWQEVFRRTSTPLAPWYLVPADKRWYSRAVVSELLRTSLAGMNLTWPLISFDPDEARSRLENEEAASDVTARRLQ